MNERKVVDIETQIEAVYGWLYQIEMGLPDVSGKLPSADEIRAAKSALRAMDYLRTPPEFEVRIEKRGPFRPFGTE